MQLKKRTKHFIAGVAALAVMLAPSVASARPSLLAPCIDGFNASVSHSNNNYKATFEHYGERLIVEDHITDGYAAVAYVRVYSFQGCNGGEVPVWSTSPVDSDRFVMDHGYHDYNLGRLR